MEPIEILRERAYHARRQYRQGLIDKPAAIVAIKPFLDAWNAIAAEKAKAIGMRYRKISAQYFLEAAAG